MADVVTAALESCIEGWAAALAADSANPQPTNTLDGKTMSNAEWREKLIANIEEAQNAINQRNPAITWSGGCGRYYSRWGSWG